MMFNFRIVVASQANQRKHWKRDVSGYRCGEHYGAHRGNNQPGRPWTITHLKTGRAIGYYPQLADCRRVGRALSAQCPELSTVSRMRDITAAMTREARTVINDALKGGAV